MVSVRARTVPVKPTRRTEKPARPFGAGILRPPIRLAIAGILTLVEDENFDQTNNPAEDYRFQIRYRGKAVNGFDSLGAARLYYEMIRDGQITLDGRWVKTEPKTEPEYVRTAEEFDELDRINRENSLAACRPIRGGAPSDADWDWL
jgi:hypothetical protein